MHDHNRYTCERLSDGMAAMQWNVPFANLTAGPELRECFVSCKLPQRGLKLDEVALENPDAEILATWPVEVTASCVLQP